jgi:hypothetical protein
MEVARDMDLGSGQLNISGLELLRKGIEGNENGRLKYGGGWLTTKYYLQQANTTKVHAAAQLVIPFQDVPTPDLDGFSFDYSKMLFFLLELLSSLKCSSWTILPEIFRSHQFNLPVLLMEQTFPSLSLISLLESRYWIPCDIPHQSFANWSGGI